MKAASLGELGEVESPYKISGHLLKDTRVRLLSLLIHPVAQKPPLPKCPGGIWLTPRQRGSRSCFGSVTIFGAPAASSPGSVLCSGAASFAVLALPREPCGDFRGSAARHLESRKAEVAQSHLLPAPSFHGCMNTE